MYVFAAFELNKIFFWYVIELGLNRVSNWTGQCNFLGQRDKLKILTWDGTWDKTGQSRKGPSKTEKGCLGPLCLMCQKRKKVSLVLCLHHYRAAARREGGNILALATHGDSYDSWQLGNMPGRTSSKLVETKSNELKFVT